MIWVWIGFGAVIAIGFVVFTGAPYVPSKRRDVQRALTELYPLNKHDLLVDIGSGDGIVLRRAARLGARAVGYEIHPLLVAVSRFLSRRQPDVTTALANFWNVQMPPETTVVYTFGEGRDISKMYQKVQSESTRLNKPLAFITYGFDVPGKVPAKTVGAHHLYTIEPLQGPNGTV